MIHWLRDLIERLRRRRRLLGMAGALSLCLLAPGCAELLPGPVIVPTPPVSPVAPEDRTPAPPADATAPDVVRAVEQALTEIAQERELAGNDAGSPKRQDSPPAPGANIPGPPPSAPGPTRQANPVEHGRGVPPHVTIWGQEGCPPCAQADRELLQAGVGHTVAKDPAARPAWVQQIVAENQAVPVLTWQDPTGRQRYVVGWPGIDQFLRHFRATLEAR